MSAAPNLQPSFSPARKWSVGFNVCLAVLIVLAIVVMVNFISREYFLRLRVSARTKIELHHNTVEFVKSLTNHVRIILYYDKHEEIYSTIAELLKEYGSLNPKCISVQEVDYLRDQATAQKVKNEYKLGSSDDKNMVIFACGGNVKALYGKNLEEYSGYERVQTEQGEGFRPKVTAFLGEVAFDSYLLAVTDPRPRYVYVLQGHGEHSIESSDEESGYMKFKAILWLSHIEVHKLSLVGLEPVPTNCDLLIIPGPTATIPPNELEKIDRYLGQGGRLLALFNANSAGHPTGLEKLLTNWGVGVGNDIIREDRKHSQFGNDVVVGLFALHPVVRPLWDSKLHMSQPRLVGVVNSRRQSADDLHAEIIATASAGATLVGDEGHGKFSPVMVAVEKGIKGVVTDKGPTRIVVAGDSFFLANSWLDHLANRDFVQCAVNWLLGTTQPLAGPSPHRVMPYKLIMTKFQLQSAEWVLLAGMPGGVLFLGGLVWLRRRR